MQTSLATKMVEMVTVVSPVGLEMYPFQASCGPTVGASATFDTHSRKTEFSLDIKPSLGCFSLVKTAKQRIPQAACEAPHVAQRFAYLLNLLRTVTHGTSNGNMYHP
jgi:hypothetical protein